MKKDQTKQQKRPIHTQNQYLNFIKKNTSLIQRHAKILRNMTKQSAKDTQKLLNRLTVNSKRKEFYKKYNIAQTLSPFQSRYQKATDNQLNNSPDYPRYRQTINHIGKNGVSESQYIYDVVTPINIGNNHFSSQKKHLPSADNVKFPNINTSKSIQKSTIEIDEFNFSEHLSKRKNIHAQNNFNRPQFTQSVQKYGQKIYDLIPAFRPHNDYLKNIIRKAKKSKKILAARQDVVDEKKRYLENFLESKIILQKSTSKLSELDNNLIRLGISIGLDQHNLIGEIQESMQNIQKNQEQPEIIQQNEFNKSQRQENSKPKFKRISSINPKNCSTVNLQRSNSMRCEDASIYMLKITSYREFLFQMNLAHRVFDSLFLRQDYSTYKQSQERYKFYIGRGNNSLLIKSLLKRRYWWAQEQDPKKANFVWTQLKINILYQFMVKSQNSHLKDKLDEDVQEVEISSKKKQKNPKKFQIKAPLRSALYRAPLPQGQKKIFTKADQKLYNEFSQDKDLQKYQNFEKRLKFFPQDCLKKLNTNRSTQKVHNHFQFNYHIGNKKALFYHLKQFYQIQQKNVFEVIPLTFHIKKGKSDPQYNAFVKEFKRIKNEHKSDTSEGQISKKKFSKNVWIVKPGQLSNRGNGITVIDEIYQLNSILQRRQKHSNGTEMTYIVQKYIQKPLLYNRRKFDIRHYMMASRLHGRMRVYWFGQGYIRTSSTQYNLEEIDNQIMHLTNDAIQKYSAGYGKYEQGNKVSYNQFQRYLDSTFGQKKYSFAEQIYPKMKAIALDAIKATYLKMDPDYLQHTFEIFGLDFMIDSSFDVWLIEVNTNPCLELSSNLLSRIIPTMLEQTFRLTLDVLYPPPAHYPNSQKYLAPDNPLQRLQFELIFDQGRDGKQIEQLYKNQKQIKIENIDEEDEVYQNDGKEIDLRQEID